MPTLVECAQLDSFNEIAVEAFDLERLALIFEPVPTVERLDAQPRLRVRATLAAGLLATMVVSVLATLPASATVLARVCAIGN